MIKEEIIAGIDRKTSFKLKAYAKMGKAQGNLVEVMCCSGGCVGGCATLKTIKEAREQEEAYAQKEGSQDFQIK